jgi:DNA-binding HxlR family transcriptional regulator
LSLITKPLNTQILTALTAAPLSFPELDRALGSPPERTTRRQLRALADLRVLDRTEPYSLAKSALGLVEVVDAVGAWLALAPNGPIELGTSAAKDAMKAMGDAWASAMVRALAATPLTLVELDSLIASRTYPQLERRLALMRRTGQIEACRHRRTKRGGTPYTVTRWLRRAIVPVIAAIRWERRWLPFATTPATRIDAEAGLLLAVPTLSLATDLSGRCRLAVEIEHRAGPRVAGVMADVVGGRVVVCTSRLSGDSTASASGTGTAWLDAVSERRLDGLKMEAQLELATAMVVSLNDLSLCSAPSR